MSGGSGCHGVSWLMSSLSCSDGMQSLINAQRSHADGQSYGKAASFGTIDVPHSSRGRDWLLVGAAHSTARVSNIGLSKCWLFFTAWNPLSVAARVIT